MAARRWVASRVDHPDAALLAAELWIALLATKPESIRLTVSTAGSRTRIAAHGIVRVPVDALSEVGGRLLTAFAAAYGTSPDGCGLYAELAGPPSDVGSPALGGSASARVRPQLPDLT